MEGMPDKDVITLYRPVGQHELDLIEATEYKRFPARLPEQPIFYPVLNEEYAVQIARDWNAKHNDPPRGFVTRFSVRRSFIDQYEVQTVGAALHQEYWIPAEDLDKFNENIVGSIEVIAKFGANTEK